VKSNIDFKVRGVGDGPMMGLPDSQEPGLGADGGDWRDLNCSELHQIISTRRLFVWGQRHRIDCEELRGRKAVMGLRRSDRPCDAGEVASVSVVYRGGTDSRLEPSAGFGRTRCHHGQQTICLALYERQQLIGRGAFDISAL
jgi:hypothetical protein